MIYNRRTRVRAGNRFECVLLEPANPVADPRGVYTVGLGPDFVRESSNVLEHGRVGQDSRDTGFRLASVSSPCENQRVPRITINRKQWGFFSGWAATFQPALLFSVVFLFFFLFVRLCFPFGIESWHSWLVLELHYVSVRNCEMEKPRWAMVLRADRIRLGWPGKLSLEFLDGCCQPKWDSSFILNLPVHKNISHLLRMRLIISIIKLYHPSQSEHSILTKVKWRKRGNKVEWIGNIKPQMKYWNVW